MLETRTENKTDRKKLTKTCADEQEKVIVDGNKLHNTDRETV